MTYSVWKYPLKLTDWQPIDMPKGARLLSVAEQHGILCLWALVDTTADKTARSIVIIGTGHLAPAPTDPFTYVGSALAAAGDLVWHVFDAGELTS
jgi:hypothetical protein